MTRKTRDGRYFKALEAASDILIGDFGVPPEKVKTDLRVRKEPMMPDVYDDVPEAQGVFGHRVGVVVGVLREDTLLYFLDRFEWIVHLPLPEKFGVYMAPTHYRVFKRTRAIDDGGGATREIWGGSLTHGRSQLTMEQKVRIDANRLEKAEREGDPSDSSQLPQA